MSIWSPVKPFFSSKDKYDSGTGWPGFTRPLVTEYIVEKNGFLFVFPRTEVHSSHGDPHLGSVFDEGPKPTGLRYSRISATSRCIPVAEMKTAPYGEFLEDFRNETKKQPLNSKQIQIVISSVLKKYERLFSIIWRFVYPKLWAAAMAGLTKMVDLSQCRLLRGRIFFGLIYKTKNLITPKSFLQNIPMDDQLQIINKILFLFNNKHTGIDPTCSDALGCPRLAYLVNRQF